MLPYMHASNEMQISNWLQICFPITDHIQVPLYWLAVFSEMNGIIHSSPTMLIGAKVQLDGLLKKGTFDF